MRLSRIKARFLKSWIGQNIWYRYIKPPGAYCKDCGKYYTYHEFSSLRSERIFPQYLAAHTLCECGSHIWTFVG